MAAQKRGHLLQDTPGVLAQDDAGGVRGQAEGVEELTGVVPAADGLAVPMGLKEQGLDPRVDGARLGEARFASRAP